MKSSSTGIITSRPFLIILISLNERAQLVKVQGVPWGWRAATPTGGVVALKQIGLSPQKFYQVDARFLGLSWIPRHFGRERCSLSIIVFSQSLISDGWKDLGLGLEFEVCEDYI